LAVIAIEAVLHPAGMTTESGAVIPPVVVMVTAAPPDGAGLFNDNVHVDVPPGPSERGVHESEVTVTGSGKTLTVVEAGTLPAALVAVRVYVVVDAGKTVVEPVAFVLVKAPGVIATVAAPGAFQDTVDDWPAKTVPGAALKD